MAVVSLSLGTARNARVQPVASQGELCRGLRAAFRERSRGAYVDLDAGQELPPNLRVKVKIQVP